MPFFDNSFNTLARKINVFVYDYRLKNNIGKENQRRKMEFRIVRGIIVEWTALKPFYSESRIASKLKAKSNTKTHHFYP